MAEIPIVPEETVEAVVKEASSRMSDPDYSAVMVGEFVEGQPSISRYVSARDPQLEGADGVINTVFHAGLVAVCLERAAGRPLEEVTFADLSSVATGDAGAQLKAAQPAIWDFLAANVEGAVTRETLTFVALALHRSG